MSQGLSEDILQNQRGSSYLEDPYNEYCPHQEQQDHHSYELRDNADGGQIKNYHSDGHQNQISYAAHLEVHENPLHLQQFPSQTSQIKQRTKDQLRQTSPVNMQNQHQEYDFNHSNVNVILQAEKEGTSSAHDRQKVQNSQFSQKNANNQQQIQANSMKITGYFDKSKKQTDIEQPLYSEYVLVKGDYPSEQQFPSFEQKAAPINFQETYFTEQQRMIKILEHKYQSNINALMGITKEQLLLSRCLIIDEERKELKKQIVLLEIQNRKRRIQIRGNSATQKEKFISYTSSSQSKQGFQKLKNLKQQLNRLKQLDSQQIKHLSMLSREHQILRRKVIMISSPKNRKISVNQALSPKLIHKNERQIHTQQHIQQIKTQMHNDHLKDKNQIYVLTERISLIRESILENQVYCLGKIKRLKIENDLLIQELQIIEDRIFKADQLRQSLNLSKSRGKYKIQSCLNAIKKKSGKNKISITKLPTFEYYGKQATSPQQRPSSKNNINLQRLNAKIAQRKSLSKKSVENGNPFSSRSIDGSRQSSDKKLKRFSDYYQQTSSRSFKGIKMASKKKIVKTQSANSIPHSQKQSQEKSQAQVKEEINEFLKLNNEKIIDHYPTQNENNSEMHFQDYNSVNV